MIICWLFCRIAVWRVPKLDSETEKSFESFSVASSQERAYNVQPNGGIARFSCISYFNNFSFLIPTFVILLFRRHAFSAGFEASDRYQGCFEDFERHLRATVWSEVSFFQSACGLWCPKRISWNNMAKYLKTTNFMFGWLLSKLGLWFRKMVADS